MSQLSPSSVITSGTMKMPIIGLGTWQGKDDEIEKSLDLALSIGYRHIDTAHSYQNEKNVGKVLDQWLKSGKIKREDLFIVTKLSPDLNSPDLVEPTLKQQLEWLCLDFVDLYLIHQPFRLKKDEEGIWSKDNDGMYITEPVNHIDVWKAMEAQVDAGRAKSIGLANFNSKQILNIIENARIKPSNLQVEAHVYFQQTKLAKFCSEQGITICAYAPLGSPGREAVFKKLTGEKKLVNFNPLEDPTVRKVAESHKKNPSQILLRFLIQEGFAVIPKSCNPVRIQQNFQIFDFELADEEMEILQALDKGPAGRMFNFEFMPGVEKDPNFPFHIPY